MVEALSPISRVARFLRRAKQRLSSLGGQRADATPTNLRPPSATPNDIEYQVEYGIRNGELNAQRLQEMGIPLAGGRILEIGPGVAFGGMIYLLAAGAKVFVADRWLAPWFDDFHGPIYSGIADRLEGRSGFDVAPIRQIVSRKDYSSGKIERLFAAAEALTETDIEPFDAILSNAVLEHVEDVDQGFKALFRLTRPGGVGIHQVDYRDHRDFDHPLEHLLVEPGAFDAMNRKCNFEFGSQRRQVDYADAFSRSGFAIDKYHSNSATSDEYLKTIFQRVKTSGAKLPAQWTPSVLADVGGLFQVRRPEA